MKKCSLILLDEVNCKIKDLDLDTRRQLVRKFKYEIPGARFTPAVKLGRWDGKVSFFSLAGTTYINLLEDILPVLIDNGYEIDIDDHRIQQDFNFKLVDNNSFAETKWPRGHQLEGEPIILRDHQVKAINNYLENPQSIQEISTAAGKTLLTTALSKAVEPYGRSIVIVPNRSLVNQTREDYVNIGLDVGVFYGKERDYTKTHTIATWQSLNSIYKATKKGQAPIDIHEFLDGVVCVISDECHSVKGAVLKDILTGVMSNIPIRWGLTGTIPKEEFEFKALQTSIGNIVGRITAKELQEKGILSNCHVHIKQLQDNRVFSDYQKELKYLLTDSTRAAHIAQMISDIGKSGNTLVLLDRIQAGQQLEELLDGEAIFISGATKEKERKAEYDKVRESNNKIIIATSGIAAVGIDIPRLFNIVLIEPGKSFVKVIQSIGRGLRVAKDKNWVDIYDITSNCKYAKRHLTVRKKWYRDAEYPFKVHKLKWN